MCFVPENQQSLAEVFSFWYKREERYTRDTKNCPVSPVEFRCKFPSFVPNFFSKWVCIIKESQQKHFSEKEMMKTCQFTVWWVFNESLLFARTFSNNKLRLYLFYNVSKSSTSPKSPRLFITESKQKSQVKNKDLRGGKKQVQLKCNEKSTVQSCKDNWFNKRSILIVRANRKHTTSGQLIRKLSN